MLRAVLMILNVLSLGVSNGQFLTLYVDVSMTKLNEKLRVLCHSRKKQRLKLVSVRDV